LPAGFGKKIALLVFVSAFVSAFVSGNYNYLAGIFSSI